VLRRRSAEEIGGLGFDGLALGGLSVGEEKSATADAVAATTPLLPADRPRYLMGVGEPGDVVAAIGEGIDLFDCVFPTRVARNGLALTRQGRLVIRNAAAAGEDGPVDEGCGCPACTRYGRAYLRHLIHAGEMTGMRLLTLHNLAYMRGLMTDARAAILRGSYAAFRAEQLALWRREDPA
jgi:queuine tRNA-ribosyltransferase